MWHKYTLIKIYQYFFFKNLLLLSGKGDLVGSDVDVHLQNSTESGVVKCSSDVKALTYCDLKSIYIPGLLDVLKLYPEYQQEFANDIKHDLTYNLREGHDCEVRYIIWLLY